jgi:spore coat protein U-like protein
MTLGAATITGTGNSATQNPGTITGTIASGQSGKTAGTYSKTITLNLVY